MASRLLKRHLRLVILAYVLAFIIIMYIWQNSGSSTQKVIEKSERKVELPPGTVVALLANTGQRETPLNVKKAQPELNDKDDEAPVHLGAALVVRGETVNGSTVNSDGEKQSGGEKDGGGGIGPDRTVRSRLDAVFNSVLDCPKQFPLKFLSMDNTSVDLGQDPACSWIKASVRNVEENFVALGEEMAVLKDVSLNPQKFNGAKGGEEIASVFLQKEGAEYFNVQHGFFSLPCNGPPNGVKFHVDKRNYRRSNHLNQWLSSLTCRKGNNDPAVKTPWKDTNRTLGAKIDLMDFSRGYVPGVTLALQRYEYANVYHTMLDWYNAFISLLILGIDPKAATFLIVDGHPWGKLDPTWANMFGGRGVLRAGHLPRVTTFQYMVWVPNGYHCPLFNTDRDQVPFLGELRQHFFKSYDVRSNPGPQCSHLRLLLVRRRDYLAHPRNPKGVLARKMANEDEVRDALKAAFPEHQVRAEQLDLFPIRQQLEILSQTDILVGMHGAALTYTVLLPKGAALVEMYPKYAGKTSMLFKQISHWRGIHYIQWMNQDSKNEKPNKFTYIPTNIPVDLVNQVKKKMCGNGDG